MTEVFKFFPFLFIILTISLSSFRLTQGFLIIDVFPFNGEPIALFRIAYLKDAVDFFILIESESTHSGVRKPFYYVDKFRDILLYLNSSGKIITKKISFPHHLKKHRYEFQKTWARETYQRNIAKTLVPRHFPNASFLMIVGDADEIPRLELVKGLSMRYNDFGLPFHLGMSFHYYSFKWIIPDIWQKSFVINSAGLIRLSKELSDERVKEEDLLVLHDAGWHCSYFMNSSDVVKKIKAFAHQEFNQERFLSKQWVEKCRVEGLDLFQRNTTIARYSGGKGYPACEACARLPGYRLFEIPSIKAIESGGT